MSFLSGYGSEQTTPWIHVTWEQAASPLGYLGGDDKGRMEGPTNANIWGGGFTVRSECFPIFLSWVKLSSVNYFPAVKGF